MAANCIAPTAATKLRGRDGLIEVATVGIGGMSVFRGANPEYAIVYLLGIQPSFVGRYAVAESVVNPAPLAGSHRPVGQCRWSPYGQFWRRKPTPSAGWPNSHAGCPKSPGAVSGESRLVLNEAQGPAKLAERNSCFCFPSLKTLLTLTERIAPPARSLCSRGPWALVLPPSTSNARCDPLPLFSCFPPPAK